MYQTFSMDLRLARRRSGLSQGDVARLLAVDQTTYSAIERGASAPSLLQICCLSLVFQRAFQSLFETTLEEMRPDLLERLSGLPRPKPSGPRLVARYRHINRLEQRLGDKPLGL